MALYRVDSPSEPASSPSDATGGGGGGGVDDFPCSALPLVSTTFPSTLADDQSSSVSFTSIGFSSEASDSAASSRFVSATKRAASSATVARWRSVLWKSGATAGCGERSRLASEGHMIDDQPSSCLSQNGMRDP